MAELQYRGVFWSQANGKDWTVNAFLSGNKGGLGLDVAQDRATQEALVRVLDAGLLQERGLASLQGQAINATWLDALLAPNPSRDVLVWLNDPTGTQAAWAGPRWTIFSSRCAKDFGFSPLADGPLSAAEKLAAQQGPWAAVWAIYAEAHSSFKAIAGVLGQLTPPAPTGLFDAPDQCAGYPRANEAGEAALRTALAACAALAPEPARAQVLALENAHGHRRAWLWGALGQAPLAHALQALATLADASRHAPAGATLAQLAASYQATGWQVDAAALQALAAVSSKADTEAVGAALQALYVPWLEGAAFKLQALAQAEGGLNPAASLAQPKAGLPVRPDSAGQEGLCTVFVDGLRYDVAQQLKVNLAALGAVTISAQWTCMPSVTASGKAWASPVAPWVAGQKSDEDFEPSVAADGKPLSGHHFRKLLAEHGFQVLDKHDNGDPSGKAWVECGDLDHYGHAHGLRLARDMATQLAQIVERITELQEAGWARFRIVTDHGWLLVPGGLPKSALAMFEAETRWGRCAVLKDSAHGTPLTFGWDWCPAVQIAFAPGISHFSAGEVYAHGGLSLQECLVPVLELVAAGPAQLTQVEITQISWLGLRCKVEVSPDVPGWRLDIRTKAALADSSLLSSAKALDKGRASLAVADDAHEGVAAFVVVLDAGGVVLQKMATTVGG